MNDMEAAIGYASAEEIGEYEVRAERSDAEKMARYIAKNLVAAGLADKCKVELNISERPILTVDTFGTGCCCADDCLEEAAKLVFDCTPSGVVRMLKVDLPCDSRNPRWERTNRVRDLIDSVV